MPFKRNVLTPKGTQIFGDKMSKGVIPFNIGAIMLESDVYDYPEILTFCRFDINITWMNMFDSSYYRYLSQDSPPRAIKYGYKNVYYSHIIDYRFPDGSKGFTSTIPLIIGDWYIETPGGNIPTGWRWGYPLMGARFKFKFFVDNQRDEYHEIIVDSPTVGGQGIGATPGFWVPDITQGYIDGQGSYPMHPPDDRSKTFESSNTIDTNPRLVRVDVSGVGIRHMFYSAPGHRESLPGLLDLMATVYVKNRALSFTIGIEVKMEFRDFFADSLWWNYWPGEYPDFGFN